MRVYYRPILSMDPHRSAAALSLAGGWCWFDRVERRTRGGVPTMLDLQDVPRDVLDRLTARRAPIAGLSMDRPRLMAVVDIKPDPASQIGGLVTPEQALVQARSFMAAGADILDLGAEPTRPGSDAVAEQDQLAGLGKCLTALGRDCRFSLGTRDAGVARVALRAGAVMINDVSGLTYDDQMAATVADSTAAVSLVHAQGLPDTMQDAPYYSDVILDVYDKLSVRLALAEASGIDRTRVVIDPGIGFGKTTAHNLELIRNIALFHSLGCPVLVGVSRKGFIADVADEPVAPRRMPGSLALQLELLNQGVQFLRVHDVVEMRQALILWQAVHRGEWSGAK